MSVSQGSKILASDCVSTNTASTLVLRDDNGNFSAHNITVNSVLAQVENPSYSSAFAFRGRYSTSLTGYALCGGINVQCAEANTEGWTYLTLGNTTKSNAHYNTSGRIILYNSNGESSKIEGQYSSILGGNKTYLKMEYVALYGGLCIMDNSSVEISSLYSTTKGTTSAEGWCTLTLGNSKTSTTANNASGKIVIYNKQGNSTTITGEYTALLNASSRSYIKSNQAITSCVGFAVMDSDSTEIGGFYSNTKGTTSVEGISDLLIGNSKASNVANNASGRIRIYNASGEQFWIYTRTFTIYNSGSTTTGAKFLYFGGSSDGSNIRTYINNELHTNILSITRPNTSNYSERYVYGRIDTPTLGTTSVEGKCTLTLGNNKTSTTANNASGELRLYDANGNNWHIGNSYNTSMGYLRLWYGGAADLVKIRSNGAIQAGFITKVDTGNKTFTSSTSWFYTGAAVTIPAYCYYFICGQAVYANSGPTRVALSTTSTPTSGWEQAISYYGAQGYAGYVSMCGYTTAATTFYLHAVYNGATSNWARITGGYIQSWE